MVDDMHFYENNKAKEFFLNRSYLLKGKKLNLTTEEIYSEIKEIIDILELPNFISSYPESAKNVYVLEELIVLLWNKVPTMLRRFLMDKDISPSIKGRKDKKISARIAGIQGDYPNIDIKRGDFHYSFKNGLPILVTESKSEINSEVSFLNETELKFAASLILSPHYPRCNFYFDQHNIVTINKYAVINFSPKEITDFMFEMFSIKTAHEDKITYFINQDIKRFPYRFHNFEDNIDDFDRIYFNIKTDNQLLMRTLFYLVKSRMLWANQCFGEDAISNVLFSIEGGLLLLQKKFGVSEQKIKLDVLQDIFEKNFDKGTELFDFIKEGYEKRISIVHANPKSGVEWSPFLMAEDFYEYYDISRMLLIYILIGKKVKLD